MKVKIGGDRIGSGSKMEASFNNYKRSTHDLSYLWRSTMSAGTLVPFLCEVALPGDTFDIDLNTSVLTHPTSGPLFGSYKVQLDVYQVPIRLYNAALHMNMLNIGMKMNTIQLPKIVLKAINQLDPNTYPDNQQVNPSSIFSYLGIRGLGLLDTGSADVQRLFNAVPYLDYWDIYKNYYANKQEEIGAVIHTQAVATPMTLTTCTTVLTGPVISIPINGTTTTTPVKTTFYERSSIKVNASNVDSQTVGENIYIFYNDGVKDMKIPLITLFSQMFEDETANTVQFSIPYDVNAMSNKNIYGVYYDTTVKVPVNAAPKIVTFPLENIDKMRLQLLQWPIETQYIIEADDLTPYSLPLESGTMGTPQYSLTKGQEGLALKTYQSDLFNNWLSTEFIDGEDGISAITAIDTSGGSFTIDELNMSNKIYDMLNRIALSGGSYDDWLEAVFTNGRQRPQESPRYVGGLIKELVFQEVISNAATASEPLGSLAGRGKLNGKHKGGKIIVKTDEPSYIIGLVSLTPRIDYSQGNKWDTTLKTMDDFHKPALDQIGFQDLITDQMAWFDTEIDPVGEPIFKSAGKQPAWINYMTNVNQVRGNFADPSQQMFMTLNRRYSANVTSAHKYAIRDLTTYIDPSKFNYIFADARLDAQNFWTQISCDIKARRKMSAKVIPNL